MHRFVLVMSEQEVANDSSMETIPRTDSSSQDKEMVFPSKPVLVSEGDKDREEKDEEEKNERENTENVRTLESRQSEEEIETLGVRKDVGHLSSKPEDGNGGEIDESGKLTDSSERLRDEAVDTSEGAEFKDQGSSEGVKPEYGIGIKSEETVDSVKGVNPEDFNVSEGVEHDAAVDSTEVVKSEDTSEGAEGSPPAVLSEDSPEGGSRSLATNKQEALPRSPTSQEGSSESEPKSPQSKSSDEMAKPECTEKADLPVLVGAEALSLKSREGGKDLSLLQRTDSEPPPTSETVSGDQSVFSNDVSAVDISSPSGNLEMDVSFTPGDSVIDVPTHAGMHSRGSEDPMEGVAEGDVAKDKGAIDYELLGNEMKLIEGKLVAEEQLTTKEQTSLSLQPEGRRLHKEVCIAEVVDEIVATTSNTVDDSLVKGPLAIDTVDLTKDSLPIDCSSNDAMMVENTQEKHGKERATMSESAVPLPAETASSADDPKRKEKPFSSRKKKAKGQVVDEKVIGFVKESTEIDSRVVPTSSVSTPVGIGSHPQSSTGAVKATSPLGRVGVASSHMTRSGVEVVPIPKNTRGSVAAKSANLPMLISCISPLSTTPLDSENTTSVSVPSSLSSASSTRTSSGFATLSNVDSTILTSNPSSTSSSSSSNPSLSMYVPLKSPDESSEGTAELVMVGGGVVMSSAMPALTAVASTVVTPVIATPVTSARQTTTTTKKPVLSAGLSPTLSSNLAALFARKFALASGSYSVPSMSSTESSPSLVKVQQFSPNTRPLPVVVSPATKLGNSSATKAVVITPMISDNKAGIFIEKSAGSLSESSGGGAGDISTASALASTSTATPLSIMGSPIPVITHVSTLKGGAAAIPVTPKSVVPLAASAPVLLDQGHVVAVSSTKLKAGRAKTLHSASQIQHVTTDKDVASTEKTPLPTLSLDFTQFVMPKVLGVQTVSPATKFGGKKLGKTIDLEEAIPVLRMVNTSVVGLGELRRDRIGE